MVVLTTPDCLAGHSQLFLKINKTVPISFFEKDLFFKGKWILIDLASSYSSFSFFRAQARKFWVLPRAPHNIRRLFFASLLLFLHFPLFVRTGAANHDGWENAMLHNWRIDTKKGFSRVNSKVWIFILTTAFFCGKSAAAAYLSNYRAFYFSLGPLSSCWGEKRGKGKTHSLTPRSAFAYMGKVGKRGQRAISLLGDVGKRNHLLFKFPISTDLVFAKYGRL